MREGGRGGRRGGGGWADMAAGGACSAWAGQAHHLTVLDQVAVNQITWMAAAAAAASKHPLWLVGKEGRQTQPLEWEEEGGGMYLPSRDET